jgi:hypothetical protein
MESTMKKIFLMFAVIIMLLVVYILLPDSDALRQGEIEQTASIEVSNSDSSQHNVLYPKQFSSLPRLTIKLTKGSGYLEAVEQRLDGFVFKTSSLGYSEAEGAYVEWRAKGFVDN